MHLAPIELKDCFPVDNHILNSLVLSRLLDNKYLFFNLEFSGRQESLNVLVTSYEGYRILYSNIMRMKLKPELRMYMETKVIVGIASQELFNSSDDLNLFCGIFNDFMEVRIPDCGARKWIQQNVGQKVVILQDPTCLKRITINFPELALTM